MRRRLLVIATTVGSLIAGTILISYPGGGGETLLPDGGVIVSASDPVSAALDAGAVGDIAARCPSSLTMCPDGICAETCE